METKIKTIAKNYKSIKSNNETIEVFSRNGYEVMSIKHDGSIYSNLKAKINSKKYSNH